VVEGIFNLELLEVLELISISVEIQTHLVRVIFNFSLHHLDLYLILDLVISQRVDFVQFIWCPFACHFAALNQ